MRELTINELQEISGGLYPLTDLILTIIGAAAGNLNNSVHENPHWWGAFAH